MALESGVVAKIAAAVGLAGVSSAGVYYGHSYFTPGKNLLSKYDRALIDFLGVAGQDIVFDVKTSTSSDFADSNLTFGTSTPNSVKAKVHVTVPAAGTETSFKGTNAAASLEAIKTNTKTKTPSTWTWSCELEFKREGTNASNLNEIPDKDRIMKGADQGLFGILKKDITTITNPTEQLRKQVKEAKVNFIKRCAAARGTEKNLKLDTEDHSTDANSPNTPSAAHTFSFVANATDQPNALVHKEGSDFNDWFKESYATVNYTA